MSPHALSAVVSACTDPVGAALAGALVRRGARVLLVARDADRLVALAAALAPYGDQRVRVDAIAADITSPAGCRAVRDAAVARGVNAIVDAPCEAAFACPGSAADPATATLLARTLLPHLIGQRHARVLTIGPSFVRGVQTNVRALRVNQAALRAASQALRHELAGTGVCVQYLGRRVTDRAAGLAEAGTNPLALALRKDQPEHIAAVAVQMLLAGTRERFLGVRGDLLGHLIAAAGQLFDPRVGPRRA